jgi:hypothetical protein
VSDWETECECERECVRVRVCARAHSNPTSSTDKQEDNLAGLTWLYDGQHAPNGGSDLDDLVGELTPTEGMSFKDFIFGGEAGEEGASINYTTHPFAGAVRGGSEGMDLASSPSISQASSPCASPTHESPPGSPVAAWRGLPNPLARGGSLDTMMRAKVVGGQKVAGFGMLSDSRHDKPPYSFPCLIGMAMLSKPNGRMVVGEIYSYICTNFPYFLTAKAGWKNSIRHNLSLNKLFTKVERGNDDQGKGILWAITTGMEEQIRKDIRNCEAKHPTRTRTPRLKSALSNSGSQPSLVPLSSTHLQGASKAGAPAVPTVTVAGGGSPSTILASLKTPGRGSGSSMLAGSSLESRATSGGAASAAGGSLASRVPDPHFGNGGYSQEDRDIMSFSPEIFAALTSPSMEMPLGGFDEYLPEDLRSLSPQDVFASEGLLDLPWSTDDASHLLSSMVV